ncbi:MAG: hypothetical protein HY903_20490 [Deltaproteobacteria bacterium]|nr:hypothetical protein [Deltaproteobacteria bacterium]
MTDHPLSRSLTLRLAVALAAGALVQCTNARTNDDADGAPPVGDPSAGDAPGDSDAPGPCYGQAPFIRVATAQTLDPIVEDPSRCLLYGADATGNTIYIIDTRTDLTRQVVAVGNEPTDLTLSADRRHLFVAVLGEGKLKVLDAETGALTNDVTTTVAPYKIARGPGFEAYYVEEAIFSALHLVNLETGVDTEVALTQFHEPDLEAAADGSLLFLAEANLPGSKLLRFATTPDLTQVDIFRFDGGFTLPSPQRRIFLSASANRIYFADRAFHADDLKRMRGWLGDQVLAASPDGRILATRELLFDGQTFVSFANRPHPGSGVLFSADGRWLYEFAPVGSLLYRTAIATLLGVHHLGETVVPPGALAQHNFSQILADPKRPVIYGLDSQQNQIVVIDRNTLMPLRAEIVGSSPTDMAILPGGDEMAVATFGATEIAILDLDNATKIYKRAIDVPGNPFRVVGSLLDRLAYAEQDQYSDVTLVDFETGAVLDDLTNTVFQPDVEFDPTGRYLYTGESAGPAARLLRYDVESDQFVAAGETAATYSYPMRKVIYHGGVVHFAGHKLDATTLADLGSFGEDILLLTPDGRFAVSRRRIFDAATFAEVGGLPVDSGLVAADPDNPLLYQFDNETGALFVRTLPNP